MMTMRFNLLYATTGIIVLVFVYNRNRKFRALIFYSFCKKFWTDYFDEDLFIK